MDCPACGHAPLVSSVSESGFERFAAWTALTNTPWCRVKRELKLLFGCRYRRMNGVPIDMKFQMASVFLRLTVEKLPLIALSMMTAGLIAGEPIQFSNGKSRPEPPSLDRLSKEKLAPLERVTSVNPNDEVDTSRYMSRRRDPKEEKRRKLDELERKNWMVVDKGELQAKEDEET